MKKKFGWGESFSPASFFSVLLFMILMGVFACSKAQETVRAVQYDSRIDVFIGNSLFTSYITSHEEKYPYFFPVNGPSGASVTSKRNSNFPHHSSLFFGCDHQPHPSNKWYPSPWFTRDYGFFSPMSMYWSEDIEKGTFLPERTKVHLR